MLHVHFKKAPLSLFLGTPFNEDLTDYCFILKVTRVLLFSDTCKVDQRMVNTLPIIKINPTCKEITHFYLSGKKTETWLASPISK